MTAGPWYPAASRRPTDYANTLPPLEPNAPPTLVAHTNGGPSANGSLFHWFNRPDNHIASHFQIMWDGTIEQYIPLDRQAYAQHAANAFAWSAEFQDDGNNTTPATPAQLAAFRALALDLRVPLVLAQETGNGIGWHSLYESWNTNHHDCMGAVRDAQIAELLLAPPPPQPAPQPRPTGAEAMQIIRAQGRTAAIVDSAGVGHPISSRKWTAVNNSGALTVEIATISPENWDAYIGSTPAKTAKAARDDADTYDPFTCDGNPIADTARVAP